MLAVPRWASKVMLCWMGSIVADLSASIAFYRRLGVEIPDAGVWRTPTGGHHASAADLDRRPQFVAAAGEIIRAYS